MYSKIILKSYLQLCIGTILIAIIVVLSTINVLYASDNRVKPRLIVTTDGEVDDRSSMIRLLLYACDFDIVGIVQTNSKFQEDGHSKEKWIEKLLAQYAAVLPNLRVHNPEYPDTSYLMSIIRVGNENFKDLYVAPPNMATKNTPGEQLIIERLLDNDPRPVHIAVWGGANTVASALWRLKYSGDYTLEQFQKAVLKIRIYCIWYQDGGGQWIEDNVKEAYINEAYRWDNVWDYESWDGNPKGKLSSNPKEVQEYMNKIWLEQNVKNNHGPLGSMYPQSYVSEGDTPSFLHLINNGLEAHEDYTLGGWGGRSIVDDPVNKPNHLTDATITDDGNRNKMYWRWVIPAQNDFAARMDWCVASSFSGANHAPVARIVGSNKVNVIPGETVILDGSPTTDPDNDSLTYLWWQYYDADNAVTKITIDNSTAKSGASFVVPNEPGKQIHIIFEVTDNGSPNLKGYQRIIFNIGGGVPVAGVTVFPNDVKIGIGGTIQLTAEVSPSNATNKTVTWSSSNTSVATVSSTGLVTGIAEGSATITVTTQDGGHKATCIVTVSENVAPTPLVRLGFNENNGSVIYNEGYINIKFTKTDPPSWSTNVPFNGGHSSLDFGTAYGNYYVESDEVIKQLAGMTSFTVTGWVNCKSLTVGSGGNRIVSWISEDNKHGVDIVHDANGRLRVGINQWPDNSTAISSAGKITADLNASSTNWKFFAVTYESSTSTIQFYFGDNTTPASLDKTLTYKMGSVGKNIGKLAIGHFNTESQRTSRTDRMFRGLIDQIEIHNDVLSLSQIHLIQNISGTTEIALLDGNNLQYELNAYPNPFNSSTMFRYKLQFMSRVSLKVYDVLGREVVTLIEGVKEAGTYSVQFNASGLSSGIYFAHFTAMPNNGSKPYVKVQKMLLMK